MKQYTSTELRKFGDNISSFSERKIEDLSKEAVHIYRVHGKASLGKFVSALPAMYKSAIIKRIKERLDETT